MKIEKGNVSTGRKLRIFLQLYANPMCTVRLCLNETAPLYMDGFFPDGLPAKILDFLSTHGQCTHCGAKIASNCSPCACGLETDPRIVLQVNYPTQLYQAPLGVMLNMEQNRLQMQARRRELVANGGTHSPEEIEQLYRAQSGCCYYCAKKLAAFGRKKAYQIDHLVSVWNDGGNEIGNIALTCAKCNREKGTDDSASYVRKQRRRLGKEISAAISEVHRGRHAWLKELKLGKKKR